MPKRDFPVNAFTGALYTRHDLLAGYDPADPASFQRTLDFRTYRYFVTAGRGTPADEFDSMMQALHDNSISQAVQGLIARRPVVAVMGGHKMKRDSPEYAAVVDLARKLAKGQRLVATGGGPGAMEAAHLGAHLANATDADVAAALATLATKPEVPPAADVVAADGTVNVAVADRLHAWYRPAFEVLGRAVPTGADSLAVPTWHYGHEPPTPFAGRLAKYFQNSIREDGLLALARHGIVYTEGKAGTIQEIFQDAAQNYYLTHEWFSPMVLLGKAYWTKEFPAYPLLQALFSKKPQSDLFAQRVLVTDSVDEAVAFLLRFPPP